MATQEKKHPIEAKDSSMAELAKRFRAHPLLFTGTIFILVITIVAFVFVPALAPEAGGSGKLTFGSYDGVPIDFVSGNYFASQRDYYNQQIRSSGQDQNIQFAAFQVWRAAFESTVVRTAILAETEKAGFRVPESLVDRQMAEHPAFQEEGRFSAARYRAMQDAERLNLRDSLRDDIAVSSFTEQIANLRIPTKEKEFIKAMASPERNFEFVSFPLSSYPDSEVGAFVSSQADLFKAIRLSRISIATSEADAKKVLSSIKDGSLGFEDAAKAHSKDEFADKGGDIGSKYVFELKTEISDDAARTALLALEKGAVSDIVKTASGWAIYRVEEAARDAIPSDAAVLSAARTYLQRFERGRMEDWLMAKAESFAAAARTDGFDSASKAIGSQVKSFGPVALNYGDIEYYRSISTFNIAELSGASTNEAFLTAAYSATPSSVAKPVVLGDNVLVLRVVEERAADESSTAIIDIYYPYIAGQFADRRLRDHFLTSDKLKDQFYETFIKYFLPQ